MNRNWLCGKHIDWINDGFVVRKIYHFISLWVSSWYFWFVPDFIWFCTEQYRLEHLWILLGKIRQDIVRFHLSKICHSFCQISIRKIFLFCMENLSCRLSSFLRYSPLFYHSAVHILSVLYRNLLLFGRSGDGVVVWVLSCCAERFNYGVLLWNTSFLIPNGFLFVVFRNVIVNGSLFVRRVWTGVWERVCAVIFWNEREREIW